MNAAPPTVDLVLLGGGHTHVEVLRRFAMQPMPGVRLTVLSRDAETPYSGMLPGLVAGHYDYDDVHIDLGPLALAAGARLLQDEAVALDLVAQRVLCRRRPPLAWDWLSIDIGSSPSLAVPGAADRVVPVKPVSAFHRHWTALHARLLAGSSPCRIGVIGGGAGGVELLLAVRHRLLRDLPLARHDQLAFVLVSASDDVLPGHGARARRLMREALARADVELHLGSTVVAVEAQGLRTAQGAHVALDEMLWVTQAAAAGFLRDAGLATTADGFVRVDASLRSVSHPQVFAAGDIAHVDAHPRPKAGVYAVRQGPPLADNLRRALRGEATRPFTPQREALAIISTGGHHAIATRGPFSVAGDWVWRWKDRIDRKFMARYRELAMPAMPTSMPSASSDASDMRCGGCGSKLAAGVLHNALGRLRQPPRADVLIGLDAPDDAAIVELPPGRLAVQSVDAFRRFIDDPWLFGRIAATHCLGDLHAMGATPQTALALVTLPLAGATQLRDDLATLLAGALEVLQADGVQLVGGHTAEGAECTLGFAVNGHVARDAVWPKRGLRVGDALILTKPLGSGVLLAAQMRGRVKWRWLAAACEQMAQSAGIAVRCLRDTPLSAVTDVTGFGLAGHLLEMVGDDALGVRIELDALPLYEGAAVLATDGIRSTLHAENRRVLDLLDADAAAQAHPAFELCFDPQTAGGLLCALPAADAPRVVAALRAAGHLQASRIGTVCAYDGAGPRVVITA